MHWKHDVIYFSEVPESEIPSELLEGLARLSSDARLLKVRFRWRPHGTTATGFLTKDGLLDIESASNIEIAQEVSSYARHLWVSGECEPRFEAQVYREINQPGADKGLREWRSITFYVDNPNPKTATAMTQSYHPNDESHDDHEFDDESVGDDPVERPRPRYVPPPRPRMRPSHAHKSIDAAMFGSHAGYVDLARDDPTAFAVLMTMKSQDESIDTLERVLMASLDRFDRTLAHQSSHSRFVNEALHTLTSGAGDVARVGLDLFRAGLAQQADMARLDRDSETGKERTEVMRDAVKQGSLLVQAVLMSNAVKQRQADHHGEAAETKLSPEEAELAAADDRIIEIRTRQLLELLTPKTLDDLRAHAPTVAAVFDRLRSRPITAAWVREVVCAAQDEVDANELRELGLHLDRGVFLKVNDVIARALSGGTI